MEKAANAATEDADQAQELKGRFDDYATLAVRIYERCTVEEKRYLAAPLTVGDPSIRVEGERSNKQKPEKTG